MSPRTTWTVLIVGSVLVCGSLGGLVHVAQGDIAKARTEIGSLAAQVGIARKTVQETPQLEREVIVLREVSAFVEETLPSDEDLTTLIEDLKDYLQEADVEVDSFGLRPNRPSALASASQIDPIGYTLTFDGGLFEFMRFLSRIESDERFMAVDSFKLASGSRDQMERDGRAMHHIEVDIETYTYTPVNSADAVHIEGYDRKRDLLVGAIGTRRKALRPRTYRFAGDRGRRDPWVDLRVPAMGEGGGPTVQEQIERVEVLIEQIESALTQWEAVQASTNSVDRLVKRGALEKIVSAVDEDLRRLNSDHPISYVPAARRLELEVIEPREVLRLAMEEDSLDGPTRQELTLLEEAMQRHLELAEFSLAMEAFALVGPSLAGIDYDSEREEIIQRLRALDDQARAAHDFGQLSLEFGGMVIIDGGSPVVIIISEQDGERTSLSYTVGDQVLPGLEVAAIRPGEVAFYFRGYELTRVY